MHNNYHFLKLLVPAITPHLKNSILIGCYSQNKDELIIEFENDEQVFYIKALLSGNFSCLSFPADFQRARKNSVNLFESLIGKQVVDIHLYVNERCFHLEFEGSEILLFKMHGNRSNIILYHNNEVAHIFNSQLANDWKLKLENLDRPIDQSFENFKAKNGDLKSLFPTFNKEVLDEIKASANGAANLEEQWRIIQDLIKIFESGNIYVTSDKLTLIPQNEAAHFTNPIEAINSFFIGFVSNFHFYQTKKITIQQLEKAIQRGQAYIHKNENKLFELINRADYAKIGDLLMANLHAVPQNATSVILSNFYNEGKPIDIPLKRNLSPQKNAEVYYRKSKNQSVEINNLKESIDIKKAEIIEKEYHLSNLHEITSLKALRQYIKDHELNKAIADALVYLPYHKFKYADFDIWVGKNAQANDEMLKLTFKDDLWLHAKDVAGSHVIVKYKAGKLVPNLVKEKAAQLAAYFSKRKSDSLCPVIITPRKYVRKRKGDPPGAVVVDKEEVILVVPEKWS